MAVEKSEGESWACRLNNCALFATLSIRASLKFPPTDISDLPSSLVVWIYLLFASALTLLTAYTCTI
ncbi:hypothetical protein T02_12783 [Trichinella nativa]|uniref:Uncharacterized protein n=1 Tax=Trichinella nativa TaxID=6335 RepID=A0A0V1LNE3_9BILA|nr:hypothetical protein T02_12783 [Trichinella nativa]